MDFDFMKDTHHGATVRNRQDEHRHWERVRSHLRWCAQGGRWTDADLVDDLHADTEQMTAAEVAEAKRVAREGAERAKAAWAEGSQQRALQIADEVAADVAALIGDRIISDRKLNPTSDDPRELAARIRRRG